MKPITTKDTNDCLRAPSDMKNCDDLPITRGRTESGLPFVDSVWQLSPEEIQHIAETGIIYLCFVGTITHPPVALSAYRPDYEGNSIN